MRSGSRNHANNRSNCRNPCATHQTVLLAAKEFLLSSPLEIMNPNRNVRFSCKLHNFAAPCFEAVYHCDSYNDFERKTLESCRSTPNRREFHIDDRCKLNRQYSSVTDEGGFISRHGCPLHNANLIGPAHRLIHLNRSTVFGLVDSVPANNERGAEPPGPAPPYITVCLRSA